MLIDGCAVDSRSRDNFEWAAGVNGFHVWHATLAHPFQHV